MSKVLEKVQGELGVLFEVLKGGDLTSRELQIKSRLEAIERWIKAHDLLVESERLRQQAEEILTDDLEVVEISTSSDLEVVPLPGPRPRPQIELPPVQKKPFIFTGTKPIAKFNDQEAAGILQLPSYHLPMASGLETASLHQHRQCGENFVMNLFILNETMTSHRIIASVETTQFRPVSTNLKQWIRVVRGSVIPNLIKKGFLSRNKEGGKVLTITEEGRTYLDSLNKPLQKPNFPQISQLELIN